ncbi:hypothetical protein FB567DRAFT_5227 [Paraphoma chrysanthemicola]|uniref:Uncharacterized protein n=1 Tax=Paraphoma chrysanthemicola TaxID=798071 RepID=A0A8K0W3D7_9PLEO|nr:hypothetical protein FB567DRAFT_5227 [Paraphoma chrysanthemicola]
MSESEILVNRWTAASQRTPNSSLQDEEQNPFRWFDKMDNAMLQDAIRHMYYNEDEYKALGEFMNSGSNMEVPELDSKGLQLEFQLRRVSSMCLEFLKVLTAENDRTFEMLEDAKLETARQERWWEGGNPFASLIQPQASSVWHELRSLNPPKETSFASYILDSAQIINEPTLPNQSWDEYSFLELLEEEVTEVCNMKHGGFVAGFNLCVDIKLHILHEPNTTEFHAEHSKRMAHHAKLDRSLAEMVYHDFAANSKFKEEYFVDAAKRCSATRERMNSQECKALINQACVYNSLLPLLDLLQRRAYEEIRFKVLHGLSSKLPAELALLVFEYTLAAEGIPLDPRVFIGARHRTEDTKARKSRLACSHSERAHGLGNTQMPRDRFHIDTGTHSHVLVHGDDWVETECAFKHLEDEGRGEENQKFSILRHAFDWDVPPEEFGFDSDEPGLSYSDVFGEEREGEEENML